MKYIIMEDIVECNYKDVKCIYSTSYCLYIYK